MFQTSVSNFPSLAFCDPCKYYLYFHYLYFHASTHPLFWNRQMYKRPKCQYSVRLKHRSSLCSPTNIDAVRTLFDFVRVWSRMQFECVISYIIALKCSRVVHTAAPPCNYINFVIGARLRVTSVFSSFPRSAHSSAGVFNLWSADPRWSAGSFQGVRGQPQKNWRPVTF